MPYGLPFSADAAHVYGAGQAGPLSDHRYLAPDAGYPGGLPMGDFLAQPWRVDAGDGDRCRTRLPVGFLRTGTPCPSQSGHTAPPGTAGRTRLAPYPVAQQLPAVDAGHAGDLLRR